MSYLARTVVPIAPAAFAGIGIASGTLCLFWLWMSVIALRVGGLTGWIIFPTALAIAAFLGAVCWWAFRRKASEEPALIIDESGLFDNVSLVHAGRLKWRNLERVWVMGPTWMQLLCILPEDANQFVNQQNELRGLAMRLNRSLFGAPVVIPMALFSMPQDEVWRRLVQIAGASRTASAPSNLATGA
jgi:hypothetical protein